MFIPLGLASRVTQTCIMDLPLNIVWTTAVSQHGQLMHVSKWWHLAVEKYFVYCIKKTPFTLFY